MERGHMSEHLVANMIAGSTARLVAVSTLHPLDLVKTRLQYQREVALGQPYRALYRGATHAFTDAVRHEGVRALYKGLAVRLAYIMPAAGINFTIYEQVKAALTRGDWSNWRLPTSLVVGSVARAIMTFLRTPFDIVKQEVQVQGMHADTRHEHHVRGVRGVVRGIVAQHGARGFFLGYGTTLLRDVVFSVSHFGSYEVFKLALRRALGDEYARTPQEMIAGGIAGCVATLASIPIDVLKTRLQTQLALPPTLRRYSGVLDCVRVILAEEGVKAFTRGLYPRLLQTIPSASLTFAVYEKIKRFLAVD